MNKIVCDVCGTSYPEDAVQCPICGTAKTDSSKTASGTETGYAHVKGGRFSQANVRKRNAGKKELPRVVAPVKPQKEVAPKPDKEPVQPKPRRQPAERKPRQAAPVEKTKKETGRLTNFILAAIALLLVLAIVAVFVLIVKGQIDKLRPTEPSGSTGITPGTSSTVNAGIPCRGIRLALSEKTFGAVGEVFQITPIVTPEDTTDSIWYESADEKIATVDDKGIVTAVANGQVIIYVHCGQFMAECHITCEVGVDPTEPSDPNATNPSEPALQLVLKSDDISLTGYGDSAILYNGEIDPAQITWTSSDETVATVANGKVIAVGNGNATITAEYMGQTATCVVRCSNVVITDYELRTPFGLGNDFTIAVGDTIKLFMVEKESGKRVQPQDLTFTLSKEGVISIDANGKITALTTGTVTVTVTYGEHTLKCKVRVKSAN